MTARPDLSPIVLAMEDDIVAARDLLRVVAVFALYGIERDCTDADWGGLQRVVDLVQDHTSAIERQWTAAMGVIAATRQGGAHA